MGRISELFALLLLACCSSAFRFNEGSDLGAGSGMFGESGFNAVPRIGRRSAASNPFNSRFRFRFSRSGGRFGDNNAGFRFQGNDNPTDNLWQMQKRMAESVAKDKRAKEMNDPLDQEDILGANPDELNLIEDPEEMKIRDELTSLQLADKYWRDYWRDMAQILAYERNGGAKEAPVTTPLQKYLARNNISPAKFKAAKMAPILRGNY